VRGRRPVNGRLVWAGELGEPQYHHQLVDSNGAAEFAVTRFRSRSESVGTVPILPARDAFLVWVPLAPTALGRWHARYDGREIAVAKGIPFATTVLDLQRSMELRLRGPFDCLYYFLARSLLQRVALENEVSTAYSLRECFGSEDLVVAQLTRSILSANGSMGRLALDEMAVLLGAHILQRYCDSASATRPTRPGLRNWQKIRAEEFLRAHLHGNITLQELAAACSLSERQFSRSFRRTFGFSPHQYLIRLRLKQAKALLVQTRKSLAEIAQLCGFCDQPAFTRSFGRVERMTPSRWRKLNGCSAARY
jgi:AraC family transcriptional regulator